MVGASRSYANVAKSGSHGKTATVIDVEIYTKHVTNNEVQISGAKASPGEKAIVAKELLGLTRQEMQRIMEPIGRKSSLRFKLSVSINIQEKYRGKDLQIPRLSENEPPSVFYCNYLGVQHDKSKQASTTVTIGNLD